MVSQSSNEAVFAAAYVENYLDCVENLPDDIQRLLSHMYELDITYRVYMKELQQLRNALNKEEELTSQRRLFYKLEQVLISLQEVGDEKVELGQQVNDLIDNKYRQLDLDLRNLDVCKEPEPQEINHKEVERRDQTPVVNSNSNSTNNNNNNTSSSNANSNGTSASNDRGTKRARRTRMDTEPTSEPVTPEPSAITPQPRATATSSQTKKQTNSGNAGGKKKKRKSRGQAQSQQQKDDTPPREEEVPHDIDEPTYCLCDQISYGEMILCDNDLCPIEWFHFVCVALTTKPKGKWYCPKCRGDRPNIMKPKSQFLKELERYNKEKEEKA